MDVVFAMQDIMFFLHDQTAQKFLDAFVYIKVLLFAYFYMLQIIILFISTV